MLQLVGIIIGVYAIARLIEVHSLKIYQPSKEGGFIMSYSFRVRVVLIIAIIIIFFCLIGLLATAPPIEQNLY